VYEVFLERTAEHDLKRLPPKEFNRVVVRIKCYRKIQGRLDVIKSPAQKTIGASGLGNIG
jgi:mRNA-degrading endonuclease RelE of RelBE toxin-antitoxin system